MDSLLGSYQTLGQAQSAPPVMLLRCDLALRPYDLRGIDDRHSVIKHVMHVWSVPPAHTWVCLVGIYFRIFLQANSQSSPRSCCGQRLGCDSSIAPGTVDTNLWLIRFRVTEPSDSYCCDTCRSTASLPVTSKALRCLWHLKLIMAQIAAHKTLQVAVQVCPRHPQSAKAVALWSCRL